MQKWEYAESSTDEPLSLGTQNILGNQGWELVAVNMVSWSCTNERKGYTESGTTYLYNFKRPKGV